MPSTSSSADIEAQVHDPPPDYSEHDGAHAQDFNRDGPEGESLKKLLFNFPQMMANIGGSNQDVEANKSSGNDADNQSSLTSSIDSYRGEEGCYHGSDPSYHGNETSYQGSDPSYHGHDGGNDSSYRSHGSTDHGTDHGSYHGRKHSNHDRRKKRRSYQDSDTGSTDFTCISKRRSYNDGSDIMETSSFEEFKFNNSDIDMDMDSCGEDDAMGYASDMEQHSDVSITLKPGNGDGEENASSFDTDDTPDSKTGRKPITA